MKDKRLAKLEKRVKEEDRIDVNFKNKLLD